MNPLPTFSVYGISNDQVPKVAAKQQYGAQNGERLSGCVKMQLCFHWSRYRL